jgi:hypothetical protein
MHRSLSRGRTAVHWVTAVTEGKIDRPYPGLTMVSERAGQRDPANDLCVRDHFVLGGTSVGCRSRSVIASPSKQPAENTPGGRVLASPFCRASADLRSRLG